MMTFSLFIRTFPEKWAVRSPSTFSPLSLQLQGGFYPYWSAQNPQLFFLDVCELHCQELLVFIGRQAYDCRFWVVIIFFLPDINPVGSKVDCVVATEDGRQDMKDSFNEIILDDQHHQVVKDRQDRRKSIIGRQADSTCFASFVET